MPADCKFAGTKGFLLASKQAMHLGELFSFFCRKLTNGKHNLIHLQFVFDSKE